MRLLFGVPCLNVRNLFPPLLLSAIGAYCVLRMPKQPTRVQQLFMLAVAGLCFFVGLVVPAPPGFPPDTHIPPPPPGAAFSRRLRVVVLSVSIRTHTSSF